MKPHWALKDIKQYATLDGYMIVIYTFNPCHLWLRWTTEYPQEHPIPVLRRGVFFHADKRFCFVAYHDNDQEEEGDTLEHTFIKEPWPGCETRYFYFHGTIASEKSPSTSAIFSKHRPVGLLFAENYNPAEWIPPGPLFIDHYTLYPDPPSLTLIFEELYTWT